MNIFTINPDKLAMLIRSSDLNNKEELQRLTPLTSAQIKNPIVFSEKTDFSYFRTLYLERFHSLTEQGEILPGLEDFVENLTRIPNSVKLGYITTNTKTQPLITWWFVSSEETPLKLVGVLTSAVPIRPELVIQNKEILNEMVDAIINPTNYGYSGAGGLDRIIHRAAGENFTTYVQKILKESETPPKIIISPAFNIENADYIVNIVSPTYSERFEKESLHRLETAYIDILNASTNFTKISIPLIGAGSNGYPTKKAIFIAVNVIRKWITTNQNQKLKIVNLCIPDVKKFKTTQKLNRKIN